MRLRSTATNGTQWYMPSLTHSGRNIVKACLHSAAPLVIIVCNVGLQVGHTKLSVIDHSYQAASSPAWNLTWQHQNTFK